MNPTSNLRIDLGPQGRILNVQLHVTVWSGKKNYTFGKFGKDMRIAFSSARKEFQSLKNQAERLLDLHGTRFLGGWAIPEHNVICVTQSLEEIAKEYATAKEAFLHNYEKFLWLLREARLIVPQRRDDRMETVEELRARIAFRYSFFGVSLPERA